MKKTLQKNTQNISQFGRKSYLIGKLQIKYNNLKYLNINEMLFD